MKKIFISLLCALPLIGFGQNILFYNDGAMVKVQAGATLYIQGGMQNTNTGTIDNDGTIDIEGNFVNAGTWEPSQPNTLRFSGTGASDVTSGPAVFQTVEITKVGNNVNLLDPMTVNTDLNFNSAGATKVVTGNFDLKLGNTATASGADADEYVATTGTGMMQKGVTANNTFTFPIGDIANYSPLACTYTGTAYTNANLRAKANDLTHPNKPTDASDFISRYWDIDQTGITTYSNTLTGTYIPADLTGTGSLVKGAVYSGTEWFFLGAAGNGTSTVTGQTDIASADFTGTNFYGKIDVKIYLQGAYTSNAMSTNLPTLGQPTFPLTSPYLDAPATATSIPAGVTDWIEVQLRDAANPLTILGRASAFVKSDGTIRGLDGTSLPLIKNGNTSSIVAVLHRNHLPIRTPAGLDVVTPTAYNFTTSPSQAYHDPNNNTNENMVDLGGGTVWGLWRGNVNSLGAPPNYPFNLALNVLDFGLEKTNSNPSQSNVYSPYDVNMDKNVNVLDLGLVKTATNPSKSAHGF